MEEGNGVEVKTEPMTEGNKVEVKPEPLTEGNGVEAQPEPMLKKYTFIHSKLENIVLIIN